MRRLLIIATLFMAAAPARATVIVDQQNTASSQSAFGPGLSDVGQSFMPTQNGINFAQFSLVTDPNPTTYRVDLYRGEGYAGPIIAASGTSSVQGGNFPFGQVVQFDFASTITLIPETAYTLRLVLVSGSASNIFVAGSLGNQYTRGTTYYGNSPAFSGDYDLTFSEGINTATVAAPEPSTAVMAGIGLAGVGIMARRRMKS